MKSPSLAFLWLAMVLIAGLGIHRAGAAEKILFSTGNKDKDPKKNSLVIKQNKPALQTLDFSRLGGRPSKAEEMAPVGAPPAPFEPDEEELAESKKDKDWLTPEDKRDRGGKDGKYGKDRDKLKENSRDEKAKLNERQKNDPNENREHENDPFRRAENQDPFGPLSSNGSSTNKILFGSANQREDQHARGRQPDGSPASRSMARSPGLGSSRTLDDQSRESTLERLGIGPRQTGSTASSGWNANPGGASSLFGIGTSQNSMNNGQVSPLGQSMGARTDDFRATGGRDSTFKSGLMSEVGNMNLGQPGGQPKAYEPPKYERKPAVLPVPQRKF